MRNMEFASGVCGGGLGRAIVFTISKIHLSHNIHVCRREGGGGEGCGGAHTACVKDINRRYVFCTLLVTCVRRFDALLSVIRQRHSLAYPLYLYIYHE